MGRMTAIITREGDVFIALCPDPDFASQGASATEARANPADALSLFFEVADASEVTLSSRGEVFVTEATFLLIEEHAA